MKTMLIVEDDFLSVNILIKIFREDYIVTNCDSGEEYYEKYSDSIFDIILMDISLKGKMNGLDLIKEIKEAPSSNSTPILCLTAHAQLNAREAALANGADLFLTKPIPNNILKAKVRSLVEKEADSG